MSSNNNQPKAESKRLGEFNRNTQFYDLSTSLPRTEELREEGFWLGVHSNDDNLMV